MSCYACVKHHAKIKRINITNSIFFRFFAKDLVLDYNHCSFPNIQAVIKPY